MWCTALAAAALETVLPVPVKINAPMTIPTNAPTAIPSMSIVSPIKNIARVRVKKIM